jgi:NAD(P)-dependent dehydrogenase (short-subunit alcohol dehydrogenase family)
MIVLVTGGSSGLGEAITRRMAQDAGNTVYFTYNSSAANAQKISIDFPNAVAIKCNFKDVGEVDDLKSRIFGLNIDVLVNNAYAGSFLKTHFQKIPAEDFAIEFKENIIPTIIITQAAIMLFRKKKCGKIITILTSALVNTPPNGSSIYVANKAYLLQLSKVWATENAKFNIASNTISPAFMQTGFTDDTDERIIEQMKEAHPLKQLLTTNEAAQTVHFLASATNQMSGIDIVINAATNMKT